MRVFGSKEAVREYAETVKKAHMNLGKKLKGKDLDKLPSLSKDFENTIKDAIEAVKQGLVEKNTNSGILYLLKSKGYDPEKVYLYGVLPREGLSDKAQKMLESAWKLLKDKRPLKRGFGRVIKIDKTTLKKIEDIINNGELSNGKKLEKIKEILMEMKSGNEYTFGRGKGIFRLSDVKSGDVEGMMEELRIPGSADGRVVIELRTTNDPEIMDWGDAYDYIISEKGWHWPYTGTGFIANRNGEIIPEYYFSWTTGKGAFPPNAMDMLGIRIIKGDGTVLKINWVG